MLPWRVIHHTGTGAVGNIALAGMNASIGCIGQRLADRAALRGRQELLVEAEGDRDAADADTDAEPESHQPAERRAGRRGQPEAEAEDVGPEEPDTPAVGVGHNAPRCGALRTRPMSFIPQQTEQQHSSLRQHQQPATPTTT